MTEYKQVCKHCGSTEVARCRWVNVNNNTLYGAFSGTTLEWCFGKCLGETQIILEEDYMDEDMEESYMEFLGNHFEYIKGVQSKYAYMGGNSLPTAIADVKEEFKEELTGIDFSHIREDAVEHYIFMGINMPEK